MSRMTCCVMALLLAPSLVLAAEQTVRTPALKLPAATLSKTAKPLKTLDLKALERSNARQQLSRCVSAGQNPDCDGDGFQSEQFGGFDCDDADGNRFPGNSEVADDTGHDEDCDYTTYGFRDVDGDGFGDRKSQNVNNAGAVIAGEDCDDLRRGVHPNAPEVCNGIDDNCDGLVDDGVQVTLFRDQDKDGFGSSKQRFLGCYQQLQAGVVTNDSDCDDADPKRNPIGGCQ